MMRRVGTIVALLILGSAGCAAGIPTQFTRPGPPPASILVLPPINDSAIATASDEFLSTVTQPLAEAGYYVFPIVVVDRMMKENGLQMPGDMHQAPLSKLQEVFGADAVMYITIRRWGAVIGGSGVTLEFRLVDARTAQQIWRRTLTATEDHGGNSSSSLGAALAALVVSTVVGAIVGPSQELVRRANTEAFSSGSERLLRGYRHLGHAEEQALFEHR